MSIDNFPRCATCKHWKRSEWPGGLVKLGSTAEKAFLMEVDIPAYRHPYGACSGMPSAPPHTMEIDHDCYVDAPFDVFTYETFGCLLHEPGE